MSLLRKYVNDIYWWVYTQRYKNWHMVDVILANILQELLDISEDLKTVYNLKEEFLEIIHYTTYGEINNQLKKCISKCIYYNVKEYVEVTGTISRWKECISNSLLIKDIAMVLETE